MTRTDVRSHVRRSGGAHHAVVAALGGAVLVVAVLLRQDGMPAYDVMWAEDGRDFIGDAARTEGTTVLRQYAGYLHLVPRVVAELVVFLLPATAWAAGMAVPRSRLRFSPWPSSAGWRPSVPRFSPA